MADKLAEFARGLGADTAGFMSDDEYYEDSDPKELVEEAWMMDSTQDSFEEEGFDISDEAARSKARTAFEAGFLAAFAK